MEPQLYIPETTKTDVGLCRPFTPYTVLLSHVLKCGHFQQTSRKAQHSGMLLTPQLAEEQLLGVSVAPFPSCSHFASARGSQEQLVVSPPKPSLAVISTRLSSPPSPISASPFPHPSCPRRASRKAAEGSAGAGGAGAWWDELRAKTPAARWV